MSCANFASVTWSGGSSTLWHSTHVLAVCARIPDAHAHSVSIRIGIRQSPLFCHVTINRHRHDVTQRKHADSPDQHSATLTSLAFEKREKDPNASSQSKSHDPEKFAINAPDLRGNELQTLKHEHEIPLRANSRRSGAKRIRFGSQFPRQPRRQSPENPQRDVPCHYFPQQEIRQELHVLHNGWIDLRRCFHAGRQAHAKLLDQRQMNQNQKCSKPRQDGDVNPEESGERSARHLFPTPHENHHRMTNHWHLPGDLRSHLGGKKRQRIPRKQVTTETES